MVVEASLCVLGVQRSLAQARFGLVRLLMYYLAFLLVMKSKDFYCVYWLQNSIITKA